MRYCIVSFIFLVLSFKSFKTNDRKGFIIYSVVLKKKPTRDFSGMNHTQPDSVFYSVLFENSFSIKYFSPSEKLYPDDFSFSDLDQYSLNYIDSNYSVMKGLLCNTQYKVQFQNKKLIPTSKKSKIQNIITSQYLTVNNYGDTTLYYTTTEFPKSAGILILGNMDNCIIGFESNLYKIFPISIDETTHYEAPKIKEVNSNIESIFSLKDTWIESPYGEIDSGKPFPRFSARNIRNEKISQEILKTKEIFCSIVLIVNNIQFCKDYNSSLKGYYSGADEQHFQILKAMDKIAFENGTKYIVITGDFQEHIKGLNFPNLHIIPNADEWKEKHGIYQFPLFAIVDNTGKVKDVMTLFDIDASVSYYDGLYKLTRKCNSNLK